MPTAPREFADRVKAFALSRALISALELDIFVIVSGSEGLYDVDGLISRLGLSFEIARPVFRALLATGYLESTGGKVYLGKSGRVVLEHYQSLKSWGEEMRHTYASMADLTDLMRTGEFGNTPLARFWAYKSNRPSLDAGVSATSAYSAVMDVSQGEIAASIARAFDFSGVSHLVDFGGGYGRLAMTIAEKYPRLTATIVDLESVIETTRLAVERSGLSSRIACVGADFLRDPVPTGADAVVLVRVLHDWDDGTARKLLERAWSTLDAGGTLLVCEPIRREGDDVEKDEDWFYPLMLALMGGKRRTRSELAELMRQVGFEQVSFTETGVSRNVLATGRKPARGAGASRK